MRAMRVPAPRGSMLTMCWREGEPALSSSSLRWSLPVSTLTCFLLALK